MQRLPPNQRIKTELPVLHFGKVPEFDKRTWDIRVEGLVENPIRLTYDEFLALERAVDVSDFHCVMGWSRFDNKWEGVRFSDIAKLVRPKSSARFATIEADGGYTTSLSLADSMEPDVLFAYNFDDKPLETPHGGPLRLVVPKKYAYKSADPWKEERYSD